MEQDLGSGECTRKLEMMVKGPQKDQKRTRKGTGQEEWNLDHIDGTSTRWMEEEDLRPPPANSWMDK
jgi:hypothetical protein